MKKRISTPRRDKRIFFPLLHIIVYLFLDSCDAEDKGDIPKISVKEAILELSKIYAMVHDARISLVEISEKSRKMADLFGLKLFHKILRN